MRVDKACTLIKAGKLDYFFSKDAKQETTKLVYDAIVEYIVRSRCATGSIDSLLSLSPVELVLAISNTTREAEVDVSDADRASSSEEESSETGSRGFEDQAQGSGDYDQDDELFTMTNKPGLMVKPLDISDEESDGSGGRQRVLSPSSKKRKSTKIHHTKLAIGWAKNIVANHYTTGKMRPFLGSNPGIIIFSHDKIPSLVPLMDLISDSCKFLFPFFSPLFP